MKLDSNKFLKRCNKCNHSHLTTIDFEFAMEKLQWDNPLEVDKNINFYQCEKCQQVYWEGGQFDRAQKKYNEMSESQESSTVPDESETQEESISEAGDQLKGDMETEL